jgi:hypothetical protein
METEAVHFVQRDVSTHRQDERALEDADVASDCRQCRVAGRCDWLRGLAAQFGAQFAGQNLRRVT